MSPAALDEMVRSVTAFRSWGEMVACMTAGYLPSLSSRKPAQARLARCLVARSLAVFDPATCRNWTT